VLIEHNYRIDTKRHKSIISITINSNAISSLTEWLSASTRPTRKIDIQRFDLELNDTEVKEQFQVKISNRLLALENVAEKVDSNGTWENITENIKISAKESLGYYELKQHKPWFDEECLTVHNINPC
jgi:hypothetical protein